MTIRTLQTALIAIAAAGLSLSTLHGAGLPGEYLITQYWRELGASRSALANPALLTEENYTTVRMVAAPVVGGAFFLSETGITIPVGLFQSAGVTLVSENGGNIDEGVYNPVDGSFSVVRGERQNRNVLGMLTWAVNPLRQLNLGVNLNLAYQSNFGSPRSGFGMDAGIAWRLLHHPVAGYHIVGAAMQNLLPPSLTTGSGTMEEAYARNLRLSWQGTYFENRASTGVDVRFRDLGTDKGEFLLPNPQPAQRWLVTMRASGTLLRTISLHGLLGIQPEGMDYWGLGAGFNVLSLTGGRDLRFLYQFSAKNEEGTPLAHSFYLQSELGMHREEIYARRAARRLSAIPSELYNRAMRLYSAGRYWDAFFVYSTIENEYPDFFRNDWVGYYRARCLEEMDMRPAAIDALREVKARYHLSPTKPYASLALMRLYYRTETFTELHQQFEELDKAETPDSLLYHARYLAGQALLKQGRLRGALAAFEGIPPHHPDYLFASHSSAIASFSLNEDERALEYLGWCINTTPTGTAQEEVVQRSYLLAGYTFYESRQFASAVSALRMVRRTSTYYPDAILGRGWAALQAGQWEDGMSVARELATLRQYPTLVWEGALLTASFHVHRDEDQQAHTVLVTASAAIDSFLSNPDPQPPLRAARYETDRSDYNDFSRMADELSREPSHPRTVMRLDTLHVVQRRHYERLQSYHRYRDHLERSSFFARSLEQIASDINYLLAVVENNLQRASQRTIEQRHLEQERKLDAKLRRLEEDLETRDVDE